MEQKMVNVKNRNSGWTGYQIPDTGVTRNFSPNEAKNISIEELKQLQYVAGGEFLLKNCLMIDDKDALSVLNMEDVEPEYFYSEKDIRELLERGTLDQLEDCLNFAPEGVIDLIKTIAVATELPDTRKRKMISEKTGLNIDNAIMVNTVMTADAEVAPEETKTRKAAPITGSTERKAAAPVRKYNVVSTK